MTKGYNKAFFTFSLLSMDLSDCVDTVHILNMDDAQSKLSKMQLISNSNDCNYILSDADEKILILIKFKQAVSLKSIEIHANVINEDNDISESKAISIYKLQNLPVYVNELDSLSSDESFECSKYQLSNGQIIELQNSSKLQLAIKFKDTQFIAIYLKSNQNGTDKTIINSIILKGESTRCQLKTNNDISKETDEAKLEPPMKPLQNDNNKVEPLAQIILRKDEINNEHELPEPSIEQNETISAFIDSTPKPHSTSSLDLNIFKIDTNNCYHNWACQICAYSNTPNVTECAMCDTIKPTESQTSQSSYETFVFTVEFLLSFIISLIVAEYFAPSTGNHQ